MGCRGDILVVGLAQELLLQIAKWRQTVQGDTKVWRREIDFKSCKTGACQK